MKKIMAITVFALLGSIGANAQYISLYEGVKLANRDLTGTARFVGMGGAMGALGGDISTMGVNPAGIGIYRSNDVMFSLNYAMNGTESKYGGNKYSDDKNKFAFSNIGVVLATKVGDHTPLRYMNFGFNYERKKSFYKNMSMEGLINMAGVSQTQQMAGQAYGEEEKYMLSSGVFRDHNIGWLSALGANGGLINAASGTNPQEYDPVIGDRTGYMNFFSREAGGIDKYDFNLSFNFNDRFYMGLTVGAYDVGYRKYSLYDESFSDSEGYSMESWNYIDGTGFDVKFGVIMRPFEYSPLRIGLAVHTPTFYKLSLTTEALASVDLDGQKTNYISTYDMLGNQMMETEDFRLQTPWVFNASLGYTIGTDLALGAEYEYEDYSSMKFKYTDPSGTMPETEQVKQLAKGVSTIRLGAEYKIAPEFALRLGYNYSTAIYESGAYKALTLNGVNTDTDYANTKGISNYTMGFGYRGTHFYADLAYKYNTYKEDFYAFFDAEQAGVNLLAPTKVSNNNHQVYLTLGMRF